MRRELLLVVAVALVGAACGDTSAETVATTSSPTAATDATDADGVSPTTTSVSATTTPTTTPTTEPSDTLAPTTTSTTTVTPTTVPPTTSPPGGRDPSLTELAQQDLARRLGLDQGAISVVVAQDVTWRNGSLGCPEPGMSYSQALVDGDAKVTSRKVLVKGRELAPAGSLIIMPGDELAHERPAQ